MTKIFFTLIGLLAFDPHMCHDVPFIKKRRWSIGLMVLLLDRWQSLFSKVRNDILFAKVFSKVISLTLERNERIVLFPVGSIFFIVLLQKIIVVFYLKEECYFIKKTSMNT